VSATAGTSTSTSTSTSRPSSAALLAKLQAIKAGLLNKPRTNNLLPAGYGSSGTVKLHHTNSAVSSRIAGTSSITAASSLHSSTSSASSSSAARFVLPVSRTNSVPTSTTTMSAVGRFAASVATNRATTATAYTRLNGTGATSVTSRPGGTQQHHSILGIPKVTNNHSSTNRITVTSNNLVLPCVTRSVSAASSLYTKLAPQPRANNAANPFL